MSRQKSRVFKLAAPRRTCAGRAAVSLSDIVNPNADARSRGAGASRPAPRVAG
jgi:hypothetical protein